MRGKNIRFRNCQAHHFGERLYPPTCHDSFKIVNKNAMARCKIGDLRGIVVESSKQTTMACAQAEPHPPKQPCCLIFREFLHLRGGWGGKAISLLFRFQSFFLHAVMHFWILSRSVCFFPFSSCPRVVWKVADFSTPHQLWTEHHSFLRAPSLFTDELSDSWGRNRVSAPQESLWESTPPWVIHLNSLNCRKSNILNLKSIPAWPSLTLCLYLLWKFSLISNTRYRFSLANSPFLFHF